MARSPAVRDRSMNQGWSKPADQAGRSPWARARERAITSLARKPLGSHLGQVPHAGDLPPAVIVAGSRDEQIVALGQKQDVGPVPGREPQSFRGAIHDFEAVHARGHELLQIFPVVFPVLGNGRDTEHALLVEQVEKLEHARRVFRRRHRGRWAARAPGRRCADGRRSTRPREQRDHAPSRPEEITL